uniref:Ornithine decarboxylase antizyme n=1 Tax=Rhodosorus marinus TaxID=101924 RepID=A0A7S0BQF5_9RHOD|mmetsp:Transcript_4157/g.5900  ORF Transcript_4157/g.5900 Transcript_4157/m.5900 type:complete len:153 (+) Transcript_4157:458-916(+)
MHGFEAADTRASLIDEGRIRIHDFAAKVFEDRNSLRGGAFVVTEDLNRGTFVSKWCLVLTEDLHFIIEGPRILSPSSRDTLISLLDTAEEIGCPRAFVCIEKSHEFIKQLIRAFCYYGFEMLHPESFETPLATRIDEKFAVMASTVIDSDSN